MNNKGFTLIELLAVIVLIALVATIGSFGVTGAQNKIKEDIWNSQYNLIKNRAIIFGEDNKLHIVNQNKSCTFEEDINGVKSTVTKNPCIEVSIQNLIERRYLSTKEQDGCGNKVLVNETFKKNMVACFDEDTCYYVNTWPVYVYIENDNVYATIVTPDKCQKE